ncbi:WD40 repeat domain-containing serine/threonine protein kinase [Actinoallomurus soli]|uniref:WD40 repeat domain-containing serine/threonine protein kinase n=1 Tax=Actinoallomurus soli TaxID=2952535 RepID=UPI0020923984|nr:serine/threonine-protein kinase [Actinoallomurus soli]MCO5970454.1 serine/threonine protein kinase [Actinoallomurus soli]
MGDASGGLVGGRYRLTELVGRGGMGRVWRGYDELLGREVAVKEVLLSADLAEPDREQLARRAIGEARAAARLDFPGIVTVYDAVEQDGAPWIIMEFVPGRSLDAVLTGEGTLTRARAATIGAGVAEALAHTHAAGVIHRDLKPGNILLAAEGPVITDFGIARILDDTTRLTGTHTVVGTPQYMSPEQLQGQELTAATDLWSLGATLFAALEGHPPFEGPTLAAIITGILTRPTPALHDAGPLADLINSLLRKDQRQRPDAPTVARRLREIQRQSAQTVLTPTLKEAPPAQPEPPRSGVPRRALVLGGLGAAVVAGASTFALLSQSQDGPARVKPAGKTGQGSAAPSANTLPGYYGKVGSVAFSADGKILVGGCDDGKVRLWNVATKTDFASLVGHTRSVGPVAISHDGKTIASGSEDSTIRLWNTVDRTAFATIAPGAKTDQLCFSPDGKILAATGYLGVVTLWDSATGKFLDRLDDQKHRLLQFSVAFSPDGTTIASGSFWGQVALWDAASHALKAVFTAGTSNSIVQVAFSPDGKTLACTSGRPMTSQGLGRSSLGLWNVATRTRTVEFQVATNLISLDTVAFSPEGAVVAGAGGNGGSGGNIMFWNIASRRGTSAFRAPGDVNSIAFDPDGKTLASGSRGVQLWDLPAG